VVGEVLDDEQIIVRPLFTGVASPVSPLVPEVMRPIEQITEELFPGVPVVAEMSTGATDATYSRSAGIPTYGVSAVAMDPDDDRAHGQDERIGIEAFFDALEFWYRLMQLMSGPQVVF
jgi:acetylornithine deacetylase/succinyl-diaminopimelate desuccinylase-like protein